MPPAHVWIEAVAQIEAMKLEIAALKRTVNMLIPQVAAKMPSSSPLPLLP